MEELKKCDIITKNKTIKKQLPVLPLKDVVIYPYMVIPLFVGRKNSINALEVAMKKDQKIFLVAQKKSEDESPNINDLFCIGTISSILQLLRLPDGTLKVLIEGEKRAKLIHILEHDNAKEYLFCEVEEINDFICKNIQLEALSRFLISQFDQYMKLNKKISPEIFSVLSGIENPSRLSDTIAAHMSIKLQDRQMLLEEEDLEKRMNSLLILLEHEIDILQIEKLIRKRIKKQTEKNQKEYYLNEQMKAIQKELSQSDSEYDEIKNLEKRIKKSKMSSDAYEKVLKELKKLKTMSLISAEATVSRNYIDTLLEVPWKQKSKIKHNLIRAKNILNKDHYGLVEVKERILEYLSVEKRVRKLKGPILCFVGPPGVGKTSLGSSIASATGRKYTRVSLGGVRDEAEIRGHRRTYIGALPGKIIQKISKSKVKNPLFLLDEIDKMSTDFRGDPSSAILEVLDPEQNISFNDHYLEVDYDLSEVMFIATANTMNIPLPLLDRMEIIRISGYTEDEKINIAKKYLIPKNIKACGIKNNELYLEEKVILSIIRYYTRESGVRNLEREIAKICRKVVKKILESSKIKSITISNTNLQKYLGVRHYRYGIKSAKNQIGQVTGLAWTEFGGELLQIEAFAMPGKGKILRTGKLGKVMQESIQAAVTVVRGLPEYYKIPSDFYENIDLHLHVPEGGIPKDGPSAGIAMCTAIVSVLTKIPVKSDIAMTGEITLRGELLPIGGLKEKLLAAHRGGIKSVLIPKENSRDLQEIPDNIKVDLDIIPISWINQVLDKALVPYV